MAVDGTGLVRPELRQAPVRSSLIAQSLVDIVAVFGEYSSMAVLLNVFDRRLRDNQAALLPLR